MTTQSNRDDESGHRSLAFAPRLNGHHDAEHDMRRAIERRTIRAVAAARRRLDCIDAGAALHAERRRTREAVLASLGGPIETGSVPYDRHRRIDAPDMHIDQIVYRPREGARVTATLYTPIHATRPTGAVFVACGHTDRAKADPEYQLLARSLCRSGLVVLVADPIGQGERHSYPVGSNPRVGWGTTEHTYAGVQCWWLGHSCARWFVEDAMAGISVLTQLPEVDPERIGITGHSGGGALVTLLGAVDERIAALAPATFVTSRDVSVLSGQAQDAEQIVLSGLARGVDHPQLLLAAAPAPVLILAAAYDFFPLEGTRATVRDCDAVLHRLGMPLIRLEVAEAGHAYSAPLRRAAASFFQDALATAGGSADPAASDVDLLVDADLAIFPEGVRAAHPDESFIFERTTEATRGACDRLSPAQARSWLLDAVTRGGDPAPERFARWFPADHVSGAVVRRGFWQTDRGVHTAAVYSEPHHDVAHLRVVVGPTTDQITEDSVDSTADSATLVLDVRGTGAVRSSVRVPAADDQIIGADYRMLCDLLSLGDSLEAARVRDVLHAVVGVHEGLIPGRSFDRVSIVGAGERTFTAAIAAAVCGAPLSLDDAHPPRIDADARTRAWDAAAGRWKWMIPGYAAAIGDDLLRRLNDPVVSGEHGDLPFLRTVRDALAHPALARIGDGDGRQE